MSTDYYWEVYDSIRVEKMGRDMGYMGTFQSEKDAIKYTKNFKKLFEGKPIIEKHKGNT